MEKHPRNIDGSAAGLDTASIAERTVLHDGPVRAIAARFPRNVNAMVTCALATVGLDATRAVLVADPALEAAVLAVDAVGRDGSELRIARRQPIAGVSGSEMAAAAWGSLVLAAGVGETLSIV
jgi:aspartate dehydrogenase